MCAATPFTFYRCQRFGSEAVKGIQAKMDAEQAERGN
jgi:hypothetical protein